MSSSMISGVPSRSSPVHGIATRAIPETGELLAACRLASLSAQAWTFVFLLWRGARGERDTRASAGECRLTA